MNFRFVEFDETTEKYDYLGSTEIKDYQKMFEMLTFMKENNIKDCIASNNTGDIFSDVNAVYRVVEVMFVFNDSYVPVEDQLIPYVLVELEEVF